MAPTPQGGGQPHQASEQYHGPDQGVKAMTCNHQDQEGRREFVPKWRREEERIIQAIDLRRQLDTLQGMNRVETWRVWQAEALEMASSRTQTD